MDKYLDSYRIAKATRRALTLATRQPISKRAWQSTLASIAAIGNRTDLRAEISRWHIVPRNQVELKRLLQLSLAYERARKRRSR